MRCGSSQDVLVGLMYTSTLDVHALCTWLCMHLLFLHCWYCWYCALGFLELAGWRTESKGFPACMWCEWPLQPRMHVQWVCIFSRKLHMLNVFVHNFCTTRSLELSSDQVKHPVHQESVMKWRQESPALAAPGVYSKYTLLKQLGYIP